MDDATPQPATARLTRRGLLVTGGVAAAGLWLGPEWSVIDGVASAATHDATLRRSGWVQVTDPAVRATVDGRSAALRLVEISDLPIAEQVPALQDHEAAFVVRLTGPDGLDAGTWSLVHSELGAFALFFAPVGRPQGDKQLYEAVIDRTVRIAGINDESVSVPPAKSTGTTEPAAARAVVVPAARAQQPVPAVPMVGTVPAVVARATPTRPATRRATRRRKPKPRRISLSRSASRRTAVAEITWAHAGKVTAVHGLLVARGRVVARAGGRVRRLARLRMRLKARRGIPRGRYELRLTVVERGGTVTRIRRTVRIR